MNSRMIFRVMLIAAAATMLTVATVAVAQPAELDVMNKSIDGNGDSNTGWGDWREMFVMLAAMAVVIVLIFALRYALKRLYGAKGLSLGKGPITVVARTGLTVRHQVHLLKIGSQTILVGTGPQGICRLGEIESDQLAEPNSHEEATS